MKYNFCVACGSSSELQHHHLVPKSLGGSDDESNLITLCNPCHGKIHGITKEWKLSELTKSSLQAKKSKGERVGSIPYGFTLALDKINLIKDDTEQAAIALCKELNQQGLSLRKISAELVKQGSKPRGGKNWHPQTITRILAANP